MERKSSGKRDAFLTQPKGTKERMKSPANVCFSRVYFIELFKVYDSLKTHNFSLEENVIKD